MENILATSLKYVLLLNIQLMTSALRNIFLNGKLFRPNPLVVDTVSLVATVLEQSVSNQSL